LIRAFGNEPAGADVRSDAGGDTTRRGDACLRAVRPHLLPYWTL
jgi:hypothetical protein